MSCFVTGDTCKTKWKGIRSSYIRSLSTKGKSGSSAGSKKPYYLAQYLTFLNAFKKSYPQEGNLQSETSNRQSESQDEELQFADEETGTHETDSQDRDENPFSRDTQLLTDLDDLGENHLVPQPDTPAAASSTSDSTDQQTDIICPVSPAVPVRSTGTRVSKVLHPVDRCAIEYFNVKKKKVETVTASRQPQKDPCEMFLLSLVPQMQSMTPREQLTFQKGILELIEKIKYPKHYPQPPIPGQQHVYPASASAGIYYNAFGARCEEQQDNNFQELTPLHSSHSHIHSQHE